MNLEEIKAFFKKLATHLNSADAATRDAVIEAIHTDARQEVWQPIATRGVAAGRGELQRELDTANGTVTTLRGQLDAANTKIREYETNAPGSKQVVAGLEEKVRGLETKAAEDTKMWRGRMKGALRKRDLADFEKELVRLGMDPQYAESERLRLEARMDYIDGSTDDELPQLRIYQSATEKVPITVPKDGNLILAVAQDSMKKAPPVARRANVDRGGGTRPIENGAGDKTTTGANVFDNIRAGVREEQKNAGPVPNIVGTFKGGANAPRPTEGAGA